MYGISVMQRSESEHWSPYYIQISSWYKIIESNLEPNAHQVGQKIVFEHAMQNA